MNVEGIRRLWDHTRWADVRLLEALRQCERVPAEAIKEYAHVIGAEETWRSRIEGRTAELPVWPTVEMEGLAPLVERSHAGYAALLARLDAAGLERGVTYTNSAGQTFTNTTGDILLQVALHGQYHRGKINLLLRQAGENPSAVDFIAFVRGVPAATTTR